MKPILFDSAPVQAEDQTLQEAVQSSETQTKPLDLVVQEICLDASHDALTYVLRSNTGHDGE